MIPIYPLTEENIRQHRGKMVCACLHDGRVFMGKLTHCKDGQIILDGEDNTRLHAAKAKTTIKKRRTVAPSSKPSSKEASIRAFGYPYGYGFGYGAGLALGLTTLALLFLI